MAAAVVAARPQTTGIRFFLARSDALMPQMAATGTAAHGMMVPPPTHTVEIWPSAASVGTSIEPVAAKVWASAPHSGRPEKPEPSNPVMVPTAVFEQGDRRARHGYVLGQPQADVI